MVRSMNPFAVFGLDVTLELSAEELEQRHLRLSRECHPDLNRDQTNSEADQLALLRRSADLNDAHRILTDRWRRAEAALELRMAGVMDATKKLEPAFLMEAMELAEAVDEVDSMDTAARSRLASRLSSAIDSYWARISTGFSTEQFDDAATTLHQSRYFRKALADLNTKTS